MVNKESQGNDSSVAPPEDNELFDTQKSDEEPSVQELDENGIPIIDEKKLAAMGKDVSRMK